MSMNRAQPFQRFYPFSKITKSLCWEMREFCSVDLANWLREQNVYFCLRLKRNHCIETENRIWVRLERLGITPGTSLYFQGIKVRKSKPLAGFDVACKWKRNYQGWTVDEAWFILTNLGNLPQAIATNNGWELKKCSVIVKVEAIT